MKKVKVVVASIAIIFVVITTAFTKDRGHSEKFDDYYSSELEEPLEISDFDNPFALAYAFVKENYCKGADKKNVVIYGYLRT